MPLKRHELTLTHVSGMDTPADQTAQLPHRLQLPSDSPAARRSPGSLCNLSCPSSHASTRHAQGGENVHGHLQPVSLVVHYLGLSRPILQTRKQRLLNAGLEMHAGTDGPSPEWDPSPSSPRKATLASLPDPVATACAPSTPGVKGRTHTPHLPAGTRSARPSTACRAGASEREGGLEPRALVMRRV